MIITIKINKDTLECTSIDDDCASINYIKLNDDNEIEIQVSKPDSEMAYPTWQQ